MNKLYIIPTPIGNLEDITLRALRILKEVDLILAEDTRQTIKLLKHYEIQKKIISYHKFNEHGTVQNIINQLESGLTIALVSDAGTPCISDPGFLLVRECLQNEISVECLPGATALIPALVNSGFPSDKFVFEGFLPQKKGRKKRMQELALEKRTIILYESPYRLVKALKELLDYFGETREACVSRELTKIYEENKIGTLKELADYFEQKTVKGEIVIVIKAEQEKIKNNEN
ncbi:MAG: 16S rRNA (cytidine(1402)-2'-O)-methyltransferase [Bacteroidetes bacterium CG02_land_8_20_14_3_00_31_25]|nr:16S rRNA (cytidine(1402)-2'-O)-methyltransferase [Bacteroidota bacterium]PIV58697.1 MAG: 16S rRNA (cytidine(1402)-2'-O)-methyltransferase [Bacteroidetes bacterium CG02_land_8_20_14_3_00_31_25]PIX33116.1 MAG: 16S rRNA (cytidine(1402)-2'-O)-methyltransferase [Bacteroidetes bacterium CG_4_8_14_3_um_filter_31_14]PIY02636.1 MAG: 16S rRNA (cytidine(1402)-2'-O)-methyltransferase [Bacteroidetes bacterium CG_4_10_14_3_um_filter_31_20]